MTARRPRPAAQGTVLPALATVLAGGALTACESPQCASTRMGEFERHGPATENHLARLELSATLKEIGLALGFVAHTRTAPVVVSGAVPVLTPTPPPAPPPQPTATPAVDHDPSGPVRVGRVARVRPHPGQSPTPSPTSPRTRPQTPRGRGGSSVF